MAAFSRFLSCTAQNSLKTWQISPKIRPNNEIIKRFMSGDRTMIIQPSRWQWHKTKDMIHFYVMIAAIPLTIFTFCMNVFIGPATLTPIPEGYEPKYWEYYRNPITRALAKYVYRTPQQDYEKFLFFIEEESENMKARALEKKVWDLMAKNDDYRGNYFAPYYSKDAHTLRGAARQERYRISEEIID